jgi:hypothetical protein
LRGAHRDVGHRHRDLGGAHRDAGHRHRDSNIAIQVISIAMKTASRVVR